MFTRDMIAWLPGREEEEVFAELENPQNGAPFKLHTQGRHAALRDSGVPLQDDSAPEVILGTDNEYLYLFPQPVRTGETINFPITIPAYPKSAFALSEYCRAWREYPELWQSQFGEGAIVKSVHIALTSGIACLGGWGDIGEQECPNDQPRFYRRHTIAENQGAKDAASIVVVNRTSTTHSSRTSSRQLWFNVTYDEPAHMDDVHDAVRSLRSLLTALSHGILSVASVEVRTGTVDFEYFNALWSSAENKARVPNFIRVFGKMPPESLLGIWLAAQNDARYCEVLDYLARYFEPSNRFYHEQLGLLVAALDALGQITIGKKFRLGNALKSWAKAYPGSFSDKCPERLVIWEEPYVRAPSGFVRTRQSQTPRDDGSKGVTVPARTGGVRVLDRHERYPGRPGV